MSQLVRLPKQRPLCSFLGRLCSTIVCWIIFHLLQCCKCRPDNSKIIQQIPQLSNNFDSIAVEKGYQLLAHIFTPWAQTRAHLEI